MQPNDQDRELTKSLEELIFGGHATRKNRLDIQRFVTTLLKTIREEVARQTTSGTSVQ